ncbi:MAG: heat-inducible transcriptional repressor HrcA [Calditerrivibrio sp.]|nr:heat-inducible transcriptional repressor HrcA [Calditerrivibrio sp.]MCA1980376.1 heat-inducible transcriptional repressor HrcA [Calditerrivibrio sp.]
MTDILSEREKVVLKMIVEEYIRTSEPVGSRFVSKNSLLGLSPASIRNVMSDLEDKDMIKQTYVSSGRVPSDSGLRYYVDKLISIKPLNISNFDNILKSKRLNVKNIFEELTLKLGEMTNSIGFVVSPKLDNMFLKHIEFIKLNRDNLLAVIVTKSGIVHNVIVETDEMISDSELSMMVNFLNEHFKDKSLLDLRSSLSKELLKEREHIDSVYSKLEKVGSTIFDGVDNEYDLIIHGINNIVDQPEFARDIDTLKKLLDVFDSKKKMLEILNKLTSKNSVKIFIGSEIGESIAEELGVVMTEYHRGANVVGMLGVIGPKRMRYPEVLPIVDYTSKLITNILTEIGGDDD